MVLNAVPVPPVTLPVMWIRDVGALHLPGVVPAKWIIAVVVPWCFAQVTLTFSVPLVCPGLVPLTGPCPAPPVAAVGVHCDTKNVIAPFAAVFSVAFLHCAP